MSVVLAYLGSTRDVIGSIARHWRLLNALARRDLSDEYVQHRLSLLWTFLLPLFTMAVYLFAFTAIWPTRVAAPQGFATDAYIFLLAGILPWLTLNQALGRASSSIVNNSNIVKQMAFPLELLPLKSLINPLTFLLVALGALIAYAGWRTGGAILAAYAWGVPLLLALTLPMFAGLSLALSTLQVFVRDTKEFVAMFLQIGLFVHPILFLPDAVPPAVRGFIYLSPFSYFIFCWQDILFYGGIERPWAWLVAGSFALGVFVLGARLFMGSKIHFGDFL